MITQEKFEKMRSDNKKEKVAKALKWFLARESLNPFSGPPCEESDVIRFLLTGYLNDEFIERR